MQCEKDSYHGGKKSKTIEKSKSTLEYQTATAATIIINTPRRACEYQYTIII